MSETVVSASGKVLAAGGYLVLDPKYSGLVVSTSSRFYTCIRRGSASQQIVVKSPPIRGCHLELFCGSGGQHRCCAEREVSEMGAILEFPNNHFI